MARHGTSTVTTIVSAYFRSLFATHCKRLLYVDNEALPAFARRSNRSISPSRRAHSSKPAAAGQTDARQFQRPSTVYVLCEQS